MAQPKWYYSTMHDNFDFNNFNSFMNDTISSSSSFTSAPSYSGGGGGSW